MMVPSNVFNSSIQQKTLGAILGDALQNQSFASIAINEMHLDSRKIKAGDVFVALKGGLYDGKRFIPEALKRGAVAVLVDESERDQLVGEYAIPVVSISQLNQHLSKFAANLFDQPSAKLSIIGITGTNGKTSCAQFLAQAIALLNGRCGVIGTTGFGEFYRSPDQKVRKEISVTGMTTPDPINVQKILAQLAENNLDHCAMEVSSHGLDQHRVEAVSINTAVFTNLSHDHLDYHGTMDAYGEAKAKLFQMPSVTKAVINLDDGYASTLIEKLPTKTQLLTFGIKQKAVIDKASLHFSIDSIEKQTDQSTQVLLTANDGQYQQQATFTTSLIGQFNFSNLLAVIATLVAEGFSLEEVVSVIGQIESIDGRMERVHSEADVQVIVDFAHTPDALEKALQSLKHTVSKNLWCVFGCGGDRDKTKRAEMAKVSEHFANHIVITSDNPRTENPERILDEIESGFEIKPVARIVDRAEAITFAVNHAKSGDVILIAGKGHEEYQIIGSEKYPFSDQAEAKKALAKRLQEEAND